ncbi:MAG: inositol monophosphatase [archaeon]
MIETAKLAAREGGKIILKYFSRDIEFSRKSDNSVVSRVDMEAEARIKEIIRGAYPHHAIMGEETGRSGSGPIVWHIDPLDGTQNFMTKIPYCCTSVGIEDSGRFVAGAIFDPFSGELYYAVPGKGAFVNGKKISVKPMPINEGNLVIDGDFRKDYAPKIRLIQEIGGNSFRMNGSCALQLAEVASGKCILSYSDKVKSYDFAAGIALVREAGGIVTDEKGNEVSPDSEMIIACADKETHKKALSVLTCPRN